MSKFKVDYKVIDVELVEQVVEAIRSGSVSIIGDRFVVATKVDLATLPETIRLHIVGGDIVMDSPEVAEIKRVLEDVQ